MTPRSRRSGPAHHNETARNVVSTDSQILSRGADSTRDLA